MCRNFAHTLTIGSGAGFSDQTGNLEKAFSFCTPIQVFFFGLDFYRYVWLRVHYCH